MNAVTPLARAVLDALDTCERGAGDTEIMGELLFGDVETHWVDRDELTETLLAMIDCGLILSRFAEWPVDHAITADPILYEITEAGCAARWALLKAERPLEYAHPVAFNSRSALTDFLRSSRL
jgi:hypothetical protein